MKIEIIAGSPREGSLTKRVALHLKNKLEKDSVHSIGFINCQEWILPPIQSVYSGVDKAPDEFKPLAERIFSADAFILVSPEYNGSFSPALKNLLDHFPKQNHKPFGLVTASPGAMGGIRAALQLQHLVMALFGICSPYMLVVPAVDKKFDEEGKLLESSFENSIHNFTSEFFWLADRIVKK